MSHPLSAEEIEIQAKARAIVDELIPYEVEAEMNGGRLPDDARERAEKMVHEAGFEAINMPKELGGGSAIPWRPLVCDDGGPRSDGGAPGSVEGPALIPRSAGPSVC